MRVSFLLSLIAIPAALWGEEVAVSTPAAKAPAAAALQTSSRTAVNTTPKVDGGPASEPSAHVTSAAVVTSASAPAVTAEIAASVFAPNHLAPVVPPGLSTATPAIWVVWPHHDAKFPFLERSFTLGNVTAGSTLTINGLPVKTSTDGAFLAMVDFSTGTFALNYEARWQEQTVSTTVMVTVGPSGGFPETEPGELLPLEPAFSVDARIGDVIPVRCKGPSGLEGSFSIRRLARKAPLVESSGPARGIYEGHYVVESGDRGKDLPVRCSLKTGSLSRLRAEAKGKVTVLPATSLGVVETKHKVTVFKSDRGGYSLFFPPGVRFEAIGKRGYWTKVRLAEDFTGFVDTWRVKALPEGTPPPRAQIGKYVNIDVTTATVRLLIDASQAVPFEIRQRIEPLGFTVRFFNAYQRFDRIRYPSNDPIIKDIRWRQEASETVSLDIDTKIAWGWGYDGYYDGKGHFVLEIRRPPSLSQETLFAGLRIVIDPGHGPQPNAIGPRGYSERDMNLLVSEELKALFEAAGAQTFMIRASSDGPGLLERPFMAVGAQGDLFISVHHNGLPVTADPFLKPRGYMHFYYHQQSKPLAAAVHASYQRNHPELADEFIRWGDLYVCRMTQMPSILTESAYMILPEHEKLLLDPEYRKKLASSIFEGVREYLTTYKGIQNGSDAERDAARVTSLEPKTRETPVSPRTQSSGQN